MYIKNTKAMSILASEKEEMQKTCSNIIVMQKDSNKIQTIIV